MSTIDPRILYARLGAIELALERVANAIELAAARLPEPHEHDFKYGSGSMSFPCWCGMPAPARDRCGKGIGPWVDNRRPTCQQFQGHEGPCV